MSPSPSPGAPTPRSRKRIAWAVVLLVMGILAVVIWQAWEAWEERRRRQVCLKQLAELAYIYVVQAAQGGGEAAKHSGPALWLSYRKGATEIRRGDERLLLCPSDGKARPPTTEAERKLWDDVDLEHAPRALCSYAGRDFVKFPLVKRGAVDNAPIAACLCHEGLAVVAFERGDAQFVTLAELGLACDDEKTVGPDSKASILRPLRYGDGSVR